MVGVDFDWRLLKWFKTEKKQKYLEVTLLTYDTTKLLYPFNENPVNHRPWYLFFEISMNKFWVKIVEKREHTRYLWRRCGTKSNRYQAVAKNGSEHGLKRLYYISHLIFNIFCNQCLVCIKRRRIWCKKKLYTCQC